MAWRVNILLHLLFTSSDLDANSLSASSCTFPQEDDVRLQAIHLVAYVSSFASFFNLAQLANAQPIRTLLHMHIVSAAALYHIVIH